MKPSERVSKNFQQNNDNIVLCDELKGSMDNFILYALS